MESPRSVDSNEKSSLLDRTSTVNLDDNRFTVDGVIAEMIIEVDEPDGAEHSPQKTIIGNSHGMNASIVVPQTGPDALSKQLFVQNLGLSSAAAVTEKSDVTTTQDSDSELQGTMPETIDLVDDTPVETTEEPSKDGKSDLEDEAQVENGSTPSTKKAKPSVKSKQPEHESETPVEDVLSPPPATKPKRGRPRKKTNFTVVKKRGQNSNTPVAKCSKENNEKDEKEDEKKAEKTEKKVEINEKLEKREMKVEKKGGKRETKVEKKGGKRETKVEKNEKGASYTPQLRVVLKKLAIPVDEDVSTPCLRLANIPEVCNRIKKSNPEIVEALFQIIYGETPPEDIDCAKYRILQFGGFDVFRDNFDSSAVAQDLNQYENYMLYNICRIFGIRLGPRDEMVDSIISYLHKPTNVLDPSMDFAYQPVVVLEHLSADDIDRICKELQASPLETPLNITKRKYKKRKSIIWVKKSATWKAKNPSATENKPPLPVSARRPGRPRKVDSLPSKQDLPEQKTPSSAIKEEVAESETPLNSTRQRLSGKRTPSSAVKPSLPEKRKQTQPVVKLKKLRSDEKETEKMNVSLKETAKENDPGLLSSKRKQRWPRKAMVESEASSEKTPEDSTVEQKQPIIGMGRRTAEKRRKPSHYGDWLSDDAPEVSISTKEPKKVGRPMKEIQKAKGTAVKIDDTPTIVISGSESEPSSENESEESESLNEETDELSDPEHCEMELSPDESKPDEEPKKQNKKGMKLSSFPQIVRSINSVTNCILQRLHVILFGTSLDPEAMKKNILNFSGFPFKKNSEDWEQKHFFLSLSASNNLLEVLEALHVKTSKDNSTALVDDLMNFLLCPCKELVNADIIVPNIKKSETKRIKTKVPSPPAKAQKQSPMPSAIQLADDFQLPLPHRKAKLGENPHVKFMIVALNYTDLDILHHVIFLHGAVKSRIRKNILEFSGFNFDDSSDNYAVRKALLVGLGSQVAKRIAFILGITPLETTHKVETLSDRIMQFLTHPSPTHQIKVKEFPQNFLLSTPSDFDVKTAFSNIPKMAGVLAKEVGIVRSPFNNSCVVKNTNEGKMQTVPSSSPGKVTVTSPGKVTVTSPKTVSVTARKTVPAGTDDTREKLQKALLLAKQRNMIKSAQLAAVSSPVSVLTQTSTPAKTATSPQKPSSVPVEINKPKLPPGQAFLIDPSKLLVLKNNQQDSSSVPSSSPNVPQTTSTTTQKKSLISVTKPISTVKQLTSIIRPSASSPSAQPPQALILRQGGLQRALLLQNPPGVSSQTLSVQNASPTYAIVRSSSSNQMKSVLLLPSTPGQSLAQLVPRPSLVVASPQLQGVVSKPGDLQITKAVSSQTLSHISELSQLVQTKTAAASSNQPAGVSLLFAAPAQKVDSAEPSLTGMHKKVNGEGEGVTLLKLAPGQALLPSVEAGKSVFFSMPSVAGTLPSGHSILLKQSTPIADNTTLCDSGYKVPLSTGFPSQDTVPDNEGTQQQVGVVYQQQFVADPSDEVLFERIRDIIHAANLEDLTLKKINEKLAIEFPLLDLSVRRPFIKATVKNIICGMTS